MYTHTLHMCVFLSIVRCHHRCENIFFESTSVCSSIYLKFILYYFKCFSLIEHTHTHKLSHMYYILLYIERWMLGIIFFKDILLDTFNHKFSLSLFALAVLYMFYISVCVCMYIIVSTYYNHVIFLVFEIDSYSICSFLFTMMNHLI